MRTPDDRNDRSRHAGHYHHNGERRRFFVRQIRKLPGRIRARPLCRDVSINGMTAKGRIARRQSAAWLILISDPLLLPLYSCNVGGGRHWRIVPASRDTMITNTLIFLRRNRVLATGQRYRLERTIINQYSFKRSCRKYNILLQGNVFEFQHSLKYAVLLCKVYCRSYFTRCQFFR